MHACVYGLYLCAFMSLCVCVCVCMCVYVCVCVCVCVHGCLCTHQQTCEHVHLCKFRSPCAHTYIHTYMHVYYCTVFGLLLLFLFMRCRGLLTQRIFCASLLASLKDENNTYINHIFVKRMTKWSLFCDWYLTIMIKFRTSSNTPCSDTRGESVT